MTTEGGESFQPAPTVDPQPRRGKSPELLKTGLFLYEGYKSLEGKLRMQKDVSLPADIVRVYEQERATIDSIFGKDHVNPNLLYHGTGLLQYAGDKYGNGTTRDFRRPLDTILENGLAPHKDPWIRTVDSVESVSFATTWPYAKWYSDKHQDPHEPLKWQYGNSTDWFSYYLMDTLITEGKNAARNPGKLPAGVLKYLRSIRGDTSATSVDSLNTLQKWISDVRSDITSTTSARNILARPTDIPNNFGAILTIDKDEVSLFDMGPGRVYEERSMEPIASAKIKALSVPLNKVDEYKKRVDALGLVIPVLPIEAVDYHFSQFPLHEVTSDRKVHRES